VDEEGDASPSVEPMRITLGSAEQDTSNRHRPIAETHRVDHELTGVAT
jgi:hypothetical protein